MWLNDIFHARKKFYLQALKFVSRILQQMYSSCTQTTMNTISVINPNQQILANKIFFLCNRWLM